MTKHSVRDGRALAASIRADRDHATHGNLWGQARSAYPYFHEGILPRKFHQALYPSNYVIGSYGTPIAWRAPLNALDMLTESGAYRSKGAGVSKYGADYVAYRVPGEDHVWIFPEVRYSVSSGTHQSAARWALQELGVEVVRYVNGK